MYIHYDDKSLAAFEAWLEVFAFPSLNYSRIERKTFLSVINVDVILMMEFDGAWMTIFTFEWQLRAAVAFKDHKLFTVRVL